MNILDQQTIYQAEDRDIINELQNRLKTMRCSCCFSQQKLSELSGVSIATIKRMESGASRDLSLSTVIRLLRAMVQLEGLDSMIPIVPDSPYITRKNGVRPKRITGKSRRI